MRYIDFDGVILDTEDILFYDWINHPERFNMPWDNVVRYIKRKNWQEILKNSNVINDSINILKNMDIDDTVILTKVHSLGNEGVAKINYLRELGVKQNIILVPFELRKCDVVQAKDNILIDDSLRNLMEWEEQGGYSMFFDKKENNIDSWGEYNYKQYQRVLRIDAKTNKKLSF